MTAALTLSGSRNRLGEMRKEEDCIGIAALDVKRVH